MATGNNPAATWRLQVGVILGVVLLIGIVAYLRYVNPRQSSRFVVFVEPGVAGDEIRLVLRDGRETARDAKIAFDQGRRVDRLLAEGQGSPLFVVNTGAGGAGGRVPVELLELVRRGIEFGARTEGAFDITCAPLDELWQRATDVGTVPGDRALVRCLELVDDGRIELGDEEVRLTRPQMKIGLDRLVRGHALAEIRKQLRQQGRENFLATVGSVVIADGRRRSEPWRVDLRDPRGDEDDAWAVIELENEAVATSFDSRNPATLDPRTGQRVGGMRSVSVVCADPVVAEVLSAALLVLGVERGLLIADRWEGVGAVFIDADGQVWPTASLEARLLVQHAPL